MEVIIAAALTSPLLMGIWADLRKRTNGQGPLAKKLDCIEGRLVRVEERIVRVEERLG